MGMFTTRAIMNARKLKAEKAKEFKAEPKKEIKEEPKNETPKTEPAKEEVKDVSKPKGKKLRDE